MPNTQKDDEAKFNETLKRMLDTKPKPHEKPKGEKPQKKGQADEAS